MHLSCTLSRSLCPVCQQKRQFSRQSPQQAFKASGPRTVHCLYTNVEVVHHPPNPASPQCLQHALELCILNICPLQLDDEGLQPRQL